MDADEVSQLVGRAFDEAPVALSVIDVTGRQVAANRRYLDLLGIDTDHLDGLTVADITSEDDAVWTANYLARVARDELQEFRTEKSFRRPDGTTVRCELTTRALRDADGECRAFIGVIRPVEQPQTVTDIRLRRFLEHVDDAITLVDANGDVIETTGRHTIILGYPAEFWERRSIFDLLAPEEVERALAMHRDLLGGSVTEVQDEFEVIAADGHHEYVRLRAVNLLDDPHVRGIVISSRNVSDERQLRLDLERARDTANELASARSLLIATVSHELRNPLHAVTGMAELLVQDDLPERARPIAASLVRQLTSLSTITGDLLDATRTELGVVELHPTAVRLAELFDDTAATGRTSIGKRPVDLEVTLDAALPEWIEIDRDRLGQVLGNLIGNAVKFTDVGTIALSARRHGEHEFAIEVSDTGVGIPGDEVDQILEPFFTASNGNTRRGAGLGLSVVRHLVEAMHGTVTLTSEVGVGSVFTVVLPLSPAEAPTPARAPAGSSLRVLVVEDDPVNQQLAAAQLARLGHTSVVVGSGEAALEFLREEADAGIAVILMDERLPGMDGTETARAIRSAGLVDPDVQIISVTASATEGRRDEFIAAGVDDLLEKPVSLAALEQALTASQAHRT